MDFPIYAYTNEMLFDEYRKAKEKDPNPSMEGMLVAVRDLCRMCYEEGLRDGKAGAA